MKRSVVGDDEGVGDEVDVEVGGARMRVTPLSGAAATTTATAAAATVARSNAMTVGRAQVVSELFFAEFDF
jgi:hypothetical protein